SADVNNWFVPIVGLKTGDTSRASNTTPSADPDLSVTVAASATYELRAMLVYQANHSPGDLQIQWSLPSGATLIWSLGNFPQASGVSVGTFTWNSLVTGTNASLSGAGAGTSVAAEISGTLTISSTSGTAALQWAQFGSSGTATIMKA